MPLPTCSVPLPVSERPFSAWNLQNRSAGIQDINFDSVPNGSSFFAKHASSTFLRKCATRQFAHYEPLGCCSSCVLASVTTISRTTGWPSGISDRCLSDSAVRRDNSDRCIAVSMRRKEWPRTKTSCMAKTSRSCCSLPSLLSSAKANSSWGSSMECSAEIPTRTPRACGSFAQHSGDFVLIFMCRLMMTAPSQLQSDKVVRGSTAETK